MTNKKLVELLKAGNFTILYQDNGNCSLYEGKFKSYDKLPEDAKEIYNFCSWETIGYLPKHVKLLVEALGGCSDSI